MYTLSSKWVKLCESKSRLFNVIGNRSNEEYAWSSVSVLKSQLLWFVINYFEVKTVHCAAIVQINSPRNSIEKTMESFSGWYSAKHFLLSSNALFVWPTADAIRTKSIGGKASNFGVRNFDGKREYENPLMKINGSNKAIYIGWYDEV